MPVKPWQMTLVSLLIHTLADADMLREAWAAIVLTGVRANMAIGCERTSEAELAGSESELRVGGLR